MQGAIGILVVNDGVALQSGITPTPAIVAGFNDGVAFEMGPDAVEDRIWIRHPGNYLALAQMSFSGTANTLFTFHLYHNAVISKFGTHRKLSGGDAGSCSILGAIFNAERGDYADVRITSDNGTGANIILIDATFMLIKMEGLVF
jgi:hypothetical protein